MGIFTNPSVSGVLAAQGQVPQILAQSAIPVGTAQSGTVAADGTITFTAALPTSYSGIWLYFPAGAISDNAGAAGFYWCTSIALSLTNFQVKNSYLASMGIPAVPTPTGNAVGSNVAYTGTTVEITLASVTVPGGSIGPNGSMRLVSSWSFLSSASDKVPRAYVGGWMILSGVQGAGVTASNCARTFADVKNIGSQSHQLTTPYTLFAASAATIRRLSVNTAIDQALTHTVAQTSATDYMILESQTIEILPGA